MGKTFTTIWKDFLMGIPIAQLKVNSHIYKDKWDPRIFLDQVEVIAARVCLCVMREFVYLYMKAKTSTHLYPKILRTLMAKSAALFRHTICGSRNERHCTFMTRKSEQPSGNRPIGWVWAPANSILAENNNWLYNREHGITALVRWNLFLFYPPWMRSHSRGKSRVQENIIHSWQRVIYEIGGCTLKETQFGFKQMHTTAALTKGPIKIGISMSPNISGYLYHTPAVDVAHIWFSILIERP